MLKYAHERVSLDGTCRMPPDGHLECLKYAHEHGCPWDEVTCEMPPRMDIWSV